MIKIKQYIDDVYSSFTNEYKTVFKDSGIVMIALLAIIIYGFLYSYAYSPEVVENVPIAVVDMDKSENSRELTRRLDATQNIKVAYETASMDEAKNMMIDSKVFGIIYIDKNFDKRINSNKTAYFSIYTDGSYFLPYKQVFLATNFVMLQMNKDIKMKRYQMSGMSEKKAQFMSQPIDTQGQFLYNRFQGYGSFLIPAILILIIQQTIVIACGMVFGKRRECGELKSLLIDQNGRGLYSSAVVIGRAIYYTITNLALWLFVIGIIYPIFNFPANGDIVEIFALMIPYILASSFMGIAISTLFKYRESVILYFFFTSIPLLILSGVSWPHIGMPPFIVTLSKIFPSSIAIDGFARVQTTGANITHIAPNYYILWIQAVILFVIATILIRTLKNKCNRLRSDVLL